MEESCQLEVSLLAYSGSMEAGVILQGRMHRHGKYIQGVTEKIMER